MISPKPRIDSVGNITPRKATKVERLTQICGTDSRTATAHPSTPTPTAPPDWVDYEQAEKAIFAAFNGPDGYARVLAADYGRNFGPDVVAPEIVADLGREFFSKVSALAVEQGTRRVFGDDHLQSKCQQWAEMWCQIAHQYQQNKSDKAAAIKKNQTDRLVYTLNKFGGWIGFSLGNAKSAIKQAKAADDRARQARMLRTAGKKLQEIAEVLGVDIRTVSRYMVRKIGALVAEVEKRLTKWTSSKGWSCTDPENFDPGNRTAFAGCPTGPKATTKPRAPDEIAADPGRKEDRRRRGDLHRPTAAPEPSSADLAAAQRLSAAKG